MRINVYAEELLRDTDIVTKDAVGKDGVKRTFYGVRMYLKSHEDLHHRGDDDDRSAVTFWIPWTSANGYEPDVLIDIFESLIVAVEEIVP
jgi:hypothetical protein